MSLVHSPTIGTGERAGKVKGRKLVGQDKGDLIGKGKVAHASKARQLIHHFP